MKSLLSQCGKIKQVDTCSLVLELYLHNKPIIISSFLEEILAMKLGE